MTKVLVVGQTPPPYGGQAVMIEQLLNSRFNGVELHHVRMAFSENMDSIGRFQMQKVMHLIVVILQVVGAKIRYRPSVIYYPPAGPNKVPFLRDAAILICTRWMFSKTVLHFHASGVSSLYPKLGKLGQFMFRLAYQNPDVAIRTSDLNPDDGSFLKAKKNVVIENGLPIVYQRFQSVINSRSSHLIPQILYVGALYESKGISILVEACKLLHERGAEFDVQCVGRFESIKYETHIKHLLNKYGLNKRFSFPGVLTGDKKWNAYASADIFCFPSYFESESFGLVNIEAMQFGLPVVSTRWRGIPSVIDDGKSGFLVEIRDASSTAEKLSQLIESAELRKNMGAVGKEIYIDRFSDDVWVKNMEKVFLDRT
jgi:glycosyltransferase involved in cell wall biosynthesis